MGNALQNISPFSHVSKTFARLFAGDTCKRYPVLRQSILLMGASLFLSSVLAHADVPAHLPTDPTVEHGTAVIHTVGDQMTVTSSPNAILNWQDFSIGSHQDVYFEQNDITSQVLNRVTGTEPSQILGSLGSNGGVWLINPHGILFGPTATVNVAGLVASTLDISNLDFLAGKYNFVNGGNGKEQVTNQGEVRTSFGGRVWLLGGQVRNEGTIQSPGGNIALAAGKSLELIDSGAPNVIVRIAAPENQITNLGSLVAASGGSVDLHGSIVNQEGIARANSVGADATGRIVLKASQDLTLAENSVTQAHGGEVTMAAATTTYLAGLVDVSRQQGAAGNILLNTSKLEGVAGSSLNASGEEGGHIRIEGSGLVDFSTKLSAIGGLKGGMIEVTGDQVYLRNADVDASGGMQGGTVHVGGGWQGGGNLPHARQVLINTGSEVKADGNGSASGSAKGGEIAVWSTLSSQHYGLLQARDGGRIELSSRGTFSTQGDIQAGVGGTLLFDPKNINIRNEIPPQINVSPAAASLPGIPASLFGEDEGSDTTIFASTITGLLSEGTAVILQANNDILVTANIIVPSTENVGNLTLQAGRSINLNRNITYNSDGSIAGRNALQINTANQNLTIVAGDAGAVAGNRDDGLARLDIFPEASLNVGTGTAVLVARDGVVSNSGSIQTSGAGRWLIYARDPDSSTEGFSSFSYSKHYNQQFLGVGSETPSYARSATSGNWFLYSVAPIISVAPSSQTMTYGSSTPTTFTPTLSGFIDGDTANSLQGDADSPTFAVSGTPAWAVAGPNSSSGNLTAGGHNVAYTGGLTSDRGYQFADNTSISNELTVSRAPVFPTGITAGDKIYDATTAVTLSGGFLSGVVPRDVVSLSGATAAFNDKNVGNDKPINLSAISFTGADAGNYVAADLPGGLGSNGNTGGGPLTASITSAELTYLADQAFRLTGALIQPPPLAGRVTGFIGTDNQLDDTTGSLFWATPATAASPAGVYPIDGTGLTALNYTFQQAPSNATALTISSRGFENDNPTSTNRAMAGALPLYDPDIRCRVNDRASLPDPDFGIVSLASMSREEMQQLVVDRKERKRGVFADALCTLEGYPSYADVPSCRSLAEADSGQCKVTNAQIEEYLSRKEALAEPQLPQGRTTEAAPQATKRKGVTRLPQIERKFTVLFGIDQYSDPAIPALENAISDAEVVGTLLASELGYEVRVARNATKAEIVRAMNRLALEMRPNDSVAIYYAGHGYLDEKTGSGYWIPADASTTDPRSWISNTDISRMLSLIRSNQVMMISDSCYSGAFAKEQNVSLEGKLNPDEVLVKRSVVVMSSGGDEPVADSGRENHSIFAWYLMEALRNVDNWEPGTNLFQQVQREVRKAFPQTPQYGGVKSAGNEEGTDHLFEFRELQAR
ncbi:MAG: filamentous hemagglutinin N-terminal domain-containing protein [Nitrosospira sp.]|nr:filamentous hemagglutinin N-terminal domain-containing protein [Nitrosospira sp.]